MRKTEEDQGTMLLHYGKTILTGGAIAFTAGLGLLFLAALGISRGLLDSGLRYQFTVAACVLGSFIGGVFAVRRCSGRGLLVGLGVGVVLFCLQLTLGILTYEDFAFESGGVGLLFGSVCGGAAAGILAANTKRKRPSRAKKRRSRV